MIEALTLAASTAYAGTAKAAELPALKVGARSTISPTAARTTGRPPTFYAKVFNLEPVGATDHDVALPFGKKGETPYGVTAMDVPLSHLIIRTRNANAPQQNGTPRPKSEATIDHVCYTIADFDRERVKAELKAKGAGNVRDAGPASVLASDPFGYEIEISGLASNALGGGG